ncbi:protein COFACTOR ASSEMBLY OF COMPLEX C SUBUNIT B CCB2, chloroplastic isoform X1 [Quercus lobata]|uniref:Protein COFACTOR ASSEMBLY OF COMPLEX C SUBUNIT B CCB2, chloroplastic n=1 Tax=Quercus lobata TaxID=97700 RepID=A0A7N2RAK2_QUELO|nr:protein COFACTOR ASSEMBLY OF COMPLEX C SUBUNIT B CCB2, chloroplastic isoform X1 [Quercus lobata]
MSTNAVSMCFNPLIQLKMRPQFPAKKTTSKSTSISARNQNSQTPTNQQQQQLNLSVLRFTLGIPGLDESYLPRWIGYGFGSLLILNHFVGSDSSTTTLPQLRIETLGLSLAAFSIVIPYLGKFLKGASPADQATIPEGTEQIFVMSQNISDSLKEDLAWATYILLRNTNTIAVLISFRGELCARGYWNIPEEVSKTNLLAWFRRQMERIGLENIKDTLYFPQSSDSVLWEMLPKGTRSLLVEPVLQVRNSGANQMEKIEGFVLLASGMSYAYSDKDRAWIGALANKFGGKNLSMDL